MKSILPEGSKSICPPGSYTTCLSDEEISTGNWAEGIRCDHTYRSGGAYTPSGDTYRININNGDDIEYSIDNIEETCDTDGVCKIDNYELKKGILNEDSQLQPSSVLAYIPQTPWSSHNYEDTIEDIKEVSKCDIRPKPSVKCSDMDNMINDCEDPNRWEPGFACIYDTSTRKCSLLNVQIIILKTISFLVSLNQF